MREPATSYYYVGYGSQLGWNESHSWLVQAMPDSGGKYWHATYDGWSTLAYTFSSGGPWQVDASSETNQLNNQCRAVFSGVQKKTSPTSSWTQFSVATKACTGRFSMISPSHPYSFTTTANGL